MCGAVSYGGLWEGMYALLQHNSALIVVLVGAGSGEYFVVLYVISGAFRTTVWDNLPERFAAVFR